MKNNLMLAGTLIFLLSDFVTHTIQAQLPISPVVVNDFNVPLSMPWAGGLDAAQYNEVDLNLDGILDLLVFDRRGNRKLCFVNQGVPGYISYTYAPAFAELLPPLYEWARFVDYDMDGKMDIFTYSPGYSSMMVYHNISDNELKFKRVVYPYLTSFQGGGYVNILVINADYPGIVDVDGDGDLDILTFWGMGSFLEMHQNMSMEKYGVPDSLDFMQTTFCWGQFAESDESNVIYLDTCLVSTSNASTSVNRADRHTGSTFLFTDLNHNGLMDMLLGDVDYPGLFALYNDGTPEVALIAQVDTVFPANTEKIRLFSMPAASMIDVDNDGMKDLLVGVFDPSLITSENKNSCWLYMNVGTSEVPEFQLADKAFLQEEMIDRGSGAYPVLFDFDGDGLLDLFIGNYGYYVSSWYDNYTLKSRFTSRIGYYKNVGTPQNPVFQLWEDDFGKLSQLNLTGLIPALDDLDGDGDADMLVGKADGKLLEVINNGDGTFSVINDHYSAIDVGDYSAPQLFDLDKDGLNDLVIGEKGGNLNYYQNNGTSGNPQFEFITDSLGRVNVTSDLSYDGYSVPCFFRDAGGTTGLISGSEQGDLFYFTHIDENLTDAFSLSSNLNALLDTTGVDFDRGIRTAAAVASLRGDGALHMLVGNYSGGLELFNGEVGVLSGTNAQKPESTLRIIPNPANGRIHIQGIKAGSGVSALYAISMEGQSISLNGIPTENNGIVIDISLLKCGIYLIVYQTENTIRTGKLVVTP
ncbi:MAG: FG-GAP-like repeat-containing protein [Bacteroidales bacterium]|nr:FG-GAP-like repeat-containing protein [Bacteroidales bacterium]